MTKKTRPTWPDVLRALQDDETRSYALRRFREAGFSADSFANKTESRATVARGLTEAEDWLELRYPKRDRSALRDLRRQLEAEGDS